MATVSIDPQHHSASAPDPFVVWPRLIAIILDSIIVTVLTQFILAGWPFLTLTLFHDLGDRSLSLGLQSDRPVVSGLGVTALVYFLYFMIFEMLTAATPGKIALRIRVVDLEGLPASPTQAFIRDLLRPIDAIGAYIVGGLVVLMSRRRQRVGDHAAGTMVIDAASVRDPLRARRKSNRALPVFGAIIVAVILIDLSPLFVAPRLVLSAVTGSTMSFTSTTTVGPSGIQSIQPVGTTLLSYSPGHATYAVRWTVVDRDQRTLRCRGTVSLLWSSPVMGWHLGGVSTVCQPQP